MDILQLRNHIPIAGPAQREPVDGSETDMRVSIGIKPAWYHKRCGEVFPKTRRAVLYSPVALLEKLLESIELDLHRIFEDLAPCDVVVADIQHAIPDWKINSFLKMCQSLEEDKKDHN